MKKNFSLLFLFAALLQFALPSTAFAQLDGIGMVVELHTSTGQLSFSQGSCGYGVAAAPTWGGALPSDGICAPAAWAKPDTFGCEVLPVGSLTGKIAIIRRKTCGFSLKAYRAQQAGAKAVIILNHFDSATENDCTVVGMLAGDSAAAVKIPVIFASRGMANAIDDAIKSGNLKEICFLLPRIYSPFAAYNYFQPNSQNIPLENIGLRYVNRTNADQTNVLLKAVITEPDGTQVTIDTTLETVPAGKDSFQYLPNYQPPAGKLGKYNVVYTTNKYSEPRDSLRRSFAITNHTFGTDNGVITTNGAGPSNDQFAAAGFFQQNGALLLTGPDGGKATYATLGIANIDKLAVGDPTADVVAVFLYDGDADGDGTLDIGNGATATWDQLTDIVGTGDFTMDLNTMKPNQLFSVRITPTGATTDTFVTLLPNHPYYISMAYDGNIAGTSVGPAFSSSLDEDYLNYPSTLLFLPDANGPRMYSGYSGASIVQRLSLQGFKPGDQLISTKVPQLSATKFSVTPNPANDMVRLNLNLSDVNATVGVTLIDFQGRSVGSQVLRNFLNGQITFDAAKLPSGAYSLWIRTAEGTAMTKVMICH